MTCNHVERPVAKLLPTSSSFVSASTASSRRRTSSRRASSRARWCRKSSRRSSSPEPVRTCRISARGMSIERSSAITVRRPFDRGCNSGIPSPTGRPAQAAAAGRSASTAARSSRRARRTRRCSAGLAPRSPVQSASLTRVRVKTQQAGDGSTVRCLIRARQNAERRACKSHASQRTRAASYRPARRRIPAWSSFFHRR